MNKRQEKASLEFQATITMYALLIAIIIAFAMHSFSENRFEWGVGWGAFAVFLFYSFKRYITRKLREIFDDEHEPIR